MTAEEYKAIADGVKYFATPFAGGEGGKYTDLDSHSLGDGRMNFIEGIPIDTAMPVGDGLDGKRILREDLNAIGNLGTRELYLRQNGGYHTFSEDVARRIDGYGYGAILDWWQDERRLLRKVRCVKRGGRCFSPIDDSEHGVFGKDPYWQFVDMYDSQPNFSFNLGEEKELSMFFKKDGMESNEVELPCNCLARVVGWLSGKFVETDTPSVQKYVMRMHVAKDRESSYLDEINMTICYTGWSKNSTHFTFGGFMRKGTRVKLSVSPLGGSFNPDSIFIKVGYINYREVL